MSDCQFPEQCSFPNCFCVGNHKAKSTTDSTIRASAPMARETMEVPFYNGTDHTRMTVYKDEWEERFKKMQGIGVRIDFLK